MFYKVLEYIAKFLFLYLVFLIPYTCAFWMMFGGEVQYYMTVAETMFSLFRMTLVDYDYDALKEANPTVMTDILIGTYLAISAIILMNIFIALLSDAFVRVHDKAKANAMVQKAKIILSLDKKKTAFYNHIKANCAPLSENYDDDCEYEDNAKMELRMKNIESEITKMLKILKQQSVTDTSKQPITKNKGEQTDSQ
ncbi:uncharacterized protein LOC144364038 [Saccoglossus kowalevskii]